MPEETQTPTPETETPPTAETPAAEGAATETAPEAPVGDAGDAPVEDVADSEKGLVHFQDALNKLAAKDAAGAVQDVIEGLLAPLGYKVVDGIVVK